MPLPVKFILHEAFALTDIISYTIEVVIRQRDRIRLSPLLEPAPLLA
ncbi:hypothetical protein [Chroococcidiopsis sp. CCNUC1]|nr:hypothetical protein [Chroococcidiopsis sp. CCNUC1]URD53598.1 hypothetical protein M5J74_29970 [Chroococcidiopsis sp. CCNUC1]